MTLRSNATDWQTRLRLTAAAVLGFFQLLSMVYSGAGLISPGAMAAVYRVIAPALALGFLWPGALAVHMSLGLWKLYRRNTLRMPLWEQGQIILGLSIPPLLLSPSLALWAVDLRWHFGGIDPAALLVTYPETAWRSLAATLAVGLHAHIGTHALLRMRPWYPAAKPWVFAAFLIIPTAGALGYLASGSQAAMAAPMALSKEQLDFYRMADMNLVGALLAGYALLLALRALRIQRRSGRLSSAVVYSDGSRSPVAPETTLLEASRIAGIAHPSICGGRGRCTTCRVRVDQGAENLSPVGDRERKALLRIGAPEGIRLACQAELRRGEVRVAILLPGEVKAGAARRETRDSVGRDVELAVMFVDLRGFTRLSDQKFPYDVVYILNNYFQAMGDVILRHGGQVDKFLGDGILAYFGLDTDPRIGCREALAAARAMAEALGELNQRLANVLSAPLQLGIGLHFGDLVLGEIGTWDKRQLTIIGDTVNTASRLESLNKKLGSQLVVSSRTAALAGADLSRLRQVEVTPRGLSEPMRVYVVDDILSDLTAV